MRLPHAGLPLFALVVATVCPAAALPRPEQPPSPPAAPPSPASSATTTLSMRLLPSSNPAVLRAMLSNLADLSMLESVAVPANVSFENVLRDRCGSASLPLVTVVRGLNPAFEASVAPADRVMKLFACPHWEFDKEVTATADGRDGAVDLLRHNMGHYGPATQRQVLAKNPRLVGTFDNLKKGTTIILPYVTRQFSLPLKVDDEDTRRRVRSFERRYANLVLRPPDAEAHIGIVTDVSPAGAEAADDNCYVSDKPTWPFDRERVRGLLAEYLAPGAATKLGSATVVVADTGFDLADVSRLYVRDNDGEGPMGGRDHNNKDDDHDGFKDDRYGANMDPSGGFPARDPGYERSEHGTNVSAIALGGMQDDALTRALSGHLTVSMANIVRPYRLANRPPAWWITTTALENSLRFAENTDAAIVNWSVESSEDMPTVQAALAHLRDRLKPLVVIAAGNSGIAVDIGSYPVSYVRDVPDRILTVAAHDPDGNLLDWSNWSPGLVDIAAPGCGIDTLSPGGTRRRVSGTSFAAPLVSFTAALLQAEGLTEPAQIKWRITSTASLDSGLEDFIASKGRLDIPKALAFRYDVIEKASRAAGEPRIRVGRIVSERQVDLCGQTVPFEDLLRVAPHYKAGSDKPALVQWYDYEERSGAIIGVITKACAAPDFTIQFKDAATNAIEPVHISALADLVLSIR